MPLIIPANSITGGYEVANSLRFNDNSSDYLSKTQVTATSRRKFTLSTWLKRGNITGTFQFFVSSYISSSDRLGFYFNSDDGLAVFATDGSTTLFRHTNAKFRDTSAWLHVVYRIDTTHGNASDRARMYVNGEQITSFNSPADPTQNDDLQLGTSSYNLYIGGYDTSQYFFDGYMAETVFLDGLDHDASFFGEFDEDTGIWKPKDVSGLTFGNNGFYLPFENSGALGQDDSGNGNNFTVNNLTSIDQTTDTCTNNYATMNPLLVTSSTPSFSEGNLAITTSALSTWQSAFSTIAVTQGKWYCEIEFESGQDVMLGIVKESSATNSFTAGSNYPGINSGGYGYYEPDGNLYNNGSASSYGNSYTTGDIIGIAVDLDNNYLYFSKNGTFQNSGDPTSGATGTGGIDISSITSEPIYIASGHWKTVSGTTKTFSNFGNPPYSANGYSDANGYGNMSYSVPSGYYVLNTKNLARNG